MIRMLMFRHAESEKNLRHDIVTGRCSDSPLSANGIVQARSLGLRFMLDSYKPSWVFMSPAIRCLQTHDMALMVAGLNIRLTKIDDDLQELDQGIAGNKPRSEMYDTETIKKINADSLNFKFEGGESQAEVEQRMMRFLKRVENLNIEKGIVDVLVFSHGLALRCLLRGILDYPAKNNFFHIINLENAHAMELVFEDMYGKWKLSRYNVKC